MFLGFLKRALNTRTLGNNVGNITLSNNGKQMVYFFINIDDLVLSFVFNSEIRKYSKSVLVTSNSMRF